MLLPVETHIYLQVDDVYLDIFRNSRSCENAVRYIIVFARLSVPILYTARVLGQIR